MKLLLEIIVLAIAWVVYSVIKSITNSGFTGYVACLVVCVVGGTLVYLLTNKNLR